MKSALTSLAVLHSAEFWLSWIYPKLLQCHVPKEMLCFLPGGDAIAQRDGRQLRWGTLWMCPEWVCFLSWFVLSVGLTVMLGCSSAGPEINENWRFETESRFQSFLSALRLFDLMVVLYFHDGKYIGKANLAWAAVFSTPLPFPEWCWCCLWPIHEQKQVWERTGYK